MCDNQIIHGLKAVKINKFSTSGVENLFKTVETGKKRKQGFST